MYTTLSVDHMDCTAAPIYLKKLKKMSNNSRNNYQPNPEPFSFKETKKKPKGYQERQDYCVNCGDPFVKVNGRGKYCYDCKDPYIRKKKREEYLREHPEEST